MLVRRSGKQCKLYPGCTVRFVPLCMKGPKTVNHCGFTKSYIMQSEIGFDYTDSQDFQ
jgi:hypothetical protein